MHASSDVRRARTTLATLATCMALTLVAHGQGVDATLPQPLSSEAVAPTPPVPVPATEPSIVSLRFTPYAWLTGFDGSVSALGVAFDINATFGDIAEDSDTIVAFMGAIDGQIDRFIFQLDGAYAQAIGTTPRGFASSSGGLVVRADIDSDLRTSWLEFLAGYRIVDTPINQTDRLSIDAFAGLRYTHIGLDIRVTSSTTITLPSGTTLVSGNQTDLDSAEDWIEPFVGARASLALESRWRLDLRADVGGFDVDGASLSWQIMPTIGYEWTFDRGTIGLFAGYRALSQDYQSDAFEWDVVTHGPLLGFSVVLNF